MPEAYVVSRSRCAACAYTADLEALTPERPAPEASLRVEHLPSHPLSVIRAKPGDETRGVVGLPPAALRHRFLRIDFVETPPGVSRAWVDRVNRDPALDQGIGQRQSRLMKGALRNGVRHFVAHRRNVLSGRHQDDASAPAPVVLRSKLLHEEERGPYVLVQKVVDAFGREVGQAPASASRVVDNEDVAVAEGGFGSFLDA